MSTAAAVIEIGVLVGYLTSDVSSCYFLNTIGPDNGIGTSLTAAQMKQQASFVGWDFNNIWTIDENVSYPETCVAIQCRTFGEY